MLQNVESLTNSEISSTVYIFEMGHSERYVITEFLISIQASHAHSLITVNMFCLVRACVVCYLKNTSQNTALDKRLYQENSFLFPYESLY